MPNDCFETENDLLVALKTGDHRAFEQLYNQYKRQIYYNIYKLVHSEAIAEELTHDVFLKVWQSRSLIVVTQSFPAFLRRIATNIAIDFYRKAALDKKLRAELVAHATEFYDPFEEEVLSVDHHAFIRSLLEKLPPRRREIFSLCKLEGKSYADVAHLLGIGTGTVNDHIVKATKLIKQELMKHQNNWLLVLLFIAFSS